MGRKAIAGFAALAVMAVTAPVAVAANRRLAFARRGVAWQRRLLGRDPPAERALAVLGSRRSLDAAGRVEGGDLQT